MIKITTTNMILFPPFFFADGWTVVGLKNASSPIGAGENILGAVSIPPEALSAEESVFIVLTSY
ncbi:MAG: hypothetical protein WC565_02210 [Parcubacteria group bacterium]